MTVVIDAGPLVALADLSDPWKPAVEDLLQAEVGALIIPAPISAEVDYLIGVRVGAQARRAYLDDLAEGRFNVECLEPDDYVAVESLERRYEDLNPGLADLSVVIMARRFSTRRILTFDERHFRAIRPLQGGVFTLLPADAKR